MLHQLQPREKIPLVYVIGDTADITGYFVRAVMRDSLTGTVLATKDLVQDATLTRRYTGVINAPQDNTGRGRWIDITIGVYSDSGYSSYASIYPEQNYTAVVQERISAALLAAGATSHEAPLGGEDFDYKRIQKMFAAFAKTLSTEIQAARTEIPEQKEFDQGALVTRVREAFRGEFGGITARLEGIRADVSDISQGIPDLVAKMPDFGPIFKRFEDLGVSHESIINDIAPAIMQIVEKILTREFASFTQSASLFVPSAIRDSQAPVVAGAEKEGEPPAERPARSGKDYLGDAHMLLGKALSRV